MADSEPRNFGRGFDEWWPRLLRPIGLGLCVWEATHAARPSILFLAGGMMGLKDVIQWQRNRNGGSGAEDER